MKPVTNKLFDQIDFFNEILNKKNLMKRGKMWKKVWRVLAK